MLTLSSLHPVSASLYFLSVMLFSMFSQNPIISFLSLCGAIFYYSKLVKKQIIKEYLFYLVVFVLVSLSNPLFSHRGETILFFLNNNPITLESLYYGINIALMLISVLFWFKCFNIVMTEEKLLLVFGKLSPKIAILVSSALRFVPLLKEQSSKIRDTQKAMGFFSSESWLDKIKNSLRVYSALLTWAFENAIDTGSSMKARGYGIGKRTCFSIFKFRTFDLVSIIFLIFFDFAVLFAMAKGKLSVKFYPTLSFQKFDFTNIIAVVAFTLLCFLPFILELKEEIQWKYYKSKI